MDNYIVELAQNVTAGHSTLHLSPSFPVFCHTGDGRGHFAFGPGGKSSRSIAFKMLMIFLPKPTRFQESSRACQMVYDPEY